MYYISILSIFFTLAVAAQSPTQHSVASKGNIKAQPMPGVILSFDDKYVDDWIKADSLFQPSGWKATFFVTSFEKLSAKQKTDLLKLQQEGHEIGFHGDHHLSALPYIQQNGLPAYLQNEFTQVEPMKSYGLNVSSFAYPSGSRDNTTDSALLQQFSVLRGVGSAKPITEGKAGFYEGKPVVDAIGMEYHYNYFSEAFLLQLLERAKQTKTVLVLYGHRPVENPDKAKHEVAFATIKTICDYVRSNHMRFYTMSDLATLNKN